jgi:hypothetical protein
VPARLLASLRSILFPSPAAPQVLAELEVGREATVRGRVVPRDLIDCPLTGERCVYYQVQVEEWQPPALSLKIGGDGFWRLLERDEAIAEFYLQQGGVRAIVAPQHARVERAVGPPLTEVADYGIINRRARRLILAPGDEVEVTGLVTRATDLFDDARDYRANPSRLMLRAPEGERLKIRLL